MTEAASLMRLGRRQVFRLARAYAQGSPGALFPGKRGRRAIVSICDAVGIVRERYPDF